MTADNLRKFVVFRLSNVTEAEKYNNWQDYDSDEYDDIYDRIKHMMKNNILLKTNILIFYTSNL